MATLGSLALLQALGLAVFAEGNVIIVGSHPLEVARACNGLSMLLSFVTLITAAVLLVRRPLWERGLLLISTIPIALISNILRITVTAWSYHRLGYETTLIHDWAGIGMMVVALVLLSLELRLLSWLFVEVEEEPARLFPSAPAPKRAREPRPIHEDRLLQPDRRPRRRGDEPARRAGVGAVGAAGLAFAGGAGRRGAAPRGRGGAGAPLPGAPAAAQRGPAGRRGPGRPLGGAGGRAPAGGARAGRGR